MDRVANLSGYLQGSWRLSRRIVDRREGRLGRLGGAVVFRPDETGALQWEETGTLRLDDHEGPARQCLTVRFPEGPTGPGAVVRANGEAFFTLDLTEGVCEFVYACAPDRYFGRVCVHGRDFWTFRWIVQGPNKDQTIMSVHRRGAAEEGEKP